MPFRGMTETVSQIDVVCISCHDFLAEAAGDNGLRTKHTVKQFLQDNGLDLAERFDPGLPSYVHDQVWGYNKQLIRTRSEGS